MNGKFESSLSGKEFSSDGNSKIVGSLEDGADIIAGQYYFLDVVFSEQ